MAALILAAGSNVIHAQMLPDYTCYKPVRNTVSDADFYIQPKTIINGVLYGQTVLEVFKQFPKPDYLIIDNIFFTYTYKNEFALTPKLLPFSNGVYTIYNITNTVNIVGKAPYYPDYNTTQTYFSSSSIYCKNPPDGLTFTPAAGEQEPRPLHAEGNGKSTYKLVARVFSGGKPVVGKSITFEVIVEPGSGNHPLLPDKRPVGILNIGADKGQLARVIGTTDANGEVNLTFTATDFAGTHTIKAECTTCIATPKPTKEFKFDVKVPVLSSLAFLAGENYTPISIDGYHGASEVYYLTPAATANLKTLTTYFKSTNLAITGKPALYWNGPVGINDASLKWGGKFKAYGSGSSYPSWAVTGAHAEHRLGVQVEIYVRLIKMQQW